MGRAMGRAPSLTMDGPFAFLSLSLSSPLCLRPFPDLWIRANQRLINFSNRTKITRFAFAKYRFPYRSPSPSLSRSRRTEEAKRKGEEENFQLYSSILGKNSFSA